MECLLALADLGQVVGSDFGVPVAELTAQIL